MPMGPAQQYIVKYNDYQLPGYAQSEGDDSSMSISTHYGPYWDGGIAEYMGLANKDITLRFKVWECDYMTVKNEVAKAKAILRSKRTGWAPLLIDYTDRYWNAKAKTIRYDKVAGSSVRTGEYEVDFECQPWAIGNSIHTLTGTTIIDTDTVTRTISSGGWAPTLITVTGTNVTVSGYTEKNEFSGFISVSGTCTNLIIDTEAYTATEAGINANAKMAWKDYQMWVGPGKTTFAITGASSLSLSYHDHWY